MVIPRENEKKSEVEKKLRAFGIGFSFFYFVKCEKAGGPKKFKLHTYILYTTGYLMRIFIQNYFIFKPKQPTRDTSWITSLHLARRARAAVLDLRRNGFRLPRSRQVFA